MELEHAGSQPSVEGTAERFTGHVRVNPPNTAPAPIRVSCASVTLQDATPDC